MMKLIWFDGDFLLLPSLTGQRLGWSDSRPARIILTIDLDGLRFVNEVIVEQVFLV